MLLLPHRTTARHRRKLIRTTAALAATALAATGLAMATTAQAAPKKPADYVQQSVFTIGTPDQSDAEFKLAPSGYANLKAVFTGPDGVYRDVVYTVGVNTAADWPYIQPGPADAWAGSIGHNYTINYQLTAAQAAHDEVFQLSYVDTHNSAPPTVSAISNGTKVDTVTAPAGGGAGAAGVGMASGTVGYMDQPHQVGFLIPKSTLHTGTNTVVISQTAGSWAAYDAIAMLPAPADPGAVQVLSTSPTVLFKNDSGVDRQLVDVTVNNTAAAGSATLTATANGQTATSTVSLPAGRSTQRIEVPPSPAPGPVELDITAALSGQSAGTYAERLPYQKRWQLDVLNGSHLDIGYHYDQATTRQLQDGFLDQAVAQCTATATRPDAEKYRWTIENSWVVDNYLQDRSAAQIGALGSCLASGQIELTAKYDNNLQDLASPEQLVGSLDKGTRTLPEKFGVAVTSTVQDDVTGVTAQYVQMLAQQGVKVLINGSNPDHTGRWTDPHTDQDSPALFNWQAPDGSKVLTFLGTNVYDEGYQLDYNLKCTLAPWPNDGGSSCDTATTLPYTPVAAPSQATIDGLIPGLTSGIAARLPGLQVSKYPQSVYPLMFSEDSSPPIAGLSDVVHTFSQTYSWPKLVTSTPSRFYADATTPAGSTSADGYTPDPTSKDASALPVKQGDYTGWWSDGAGSSAFETGENMQAQDRTTSAETFGALAGLNASNTNAQCLTDSAYQEEELYTEHTWASPALQTNDPQWAVKKTRADKAARLSQDAMGSALGTLGGQVANGSANPGLSVFNSLSFARTDAVTASVPAGWSGRLVDGATGAAVPYQLSGTNQITFIAANVPAVGYRTYELLPGSNVSGSDAALSWNAATGVLENQYYRVTISPSTGVVTSVYDKAAGRELVDSSSPFKLNQYVYRSNPGRDMKTNPASQWSPSSATVTEGAAGPVSISINVAYPDTSGGKDANGKATGVESAGATITLYANTQRVDIADSIDKTAVSTVAEEGYFAFPFKEDNPTVTYETPDTPTQLGAGQIPGAAMDWQSVRSYADLSTAAGGVTLSTTDAPLMQFDHIRTMELTPRPGRLDDNATPDLSSVLPKTGSAFSYIFNSVWQTNYRLVQSGPISYHYAITSHGGAFDPVAATDYGWGAQTPLQAAPLAASQTGVYAAGAASLASLDAPNVLIQTIKQAYPVQQTASLATLPLTVRLLEVAGKSGTVHLTLPFKVTKAQLENLTENPIGSGLTVTDSSGGSTVSIPYNGHGIITVGLQPTAAYKGGSPLVCATDFALAPSSYNTYSTAFPNDVNYTAQQDTGFTAGISYPSATTPWVSAQGGSVAPPQWSYIQPGPADSWAGSKQHTFTVKFTLNSAPTTDLTLNLWLLDTQSKIPPKIGVALNGGTGQQIQLPAGGGDGYHWGDGQPNTFNGIVPSTQTITLPAGQLKAGQNTVAITTLAGSWLTYDGFAIGGPRGTS